MTFRLPPSSLPMAFVDLGFPPQLTSAAQLCWLVLSAVVLAEWKSQKVSTGGFLAPGHRAGQQHGWLCFANQECPK